MYIILEQQTSADGKVAIPPIVSKENKNEAYGAYYQALAAASVSSVPLHSVTILDNSGAEIEHKSFSHS